MQVDDSIGVFVRVRPYQEREDVATFITSQSDVNISVKEREREREQELRFSYDHIF